jgi:hypothetical protein
MNKTPKNEKEKIELTVKSDDDKTAEYLLQEANIIGTRIQWYLEQHEKIETLGIVSTGAIWAFIMTQPYNKSIIFIAWIPFFTTVVFYIKNLLFTKTINEAFQYIYELEEEYHLPKGKGWVHYFRTKSSKYKRKWRTFFWLILLLVNLLIPLLFPFEQILKSTIK